MSIYKRTSCKSCGYNNNDPKGKGGKCPKCQHSLTVSREWYARITQNGITKPVPCGELKRDAEDYVAACRLAKRRGGMLPDLEPDIPWQEASENCEKWWTEDINKNLISQNTVDSYLSMMKRLKRHFGQKTLLGMVKADVEDYIQQRLTEVKDSSVANEIVLFKRIYTLHKDRLDIEKRPRLLQKCQVMATVHPPVYDNTVERFCAMKEVQSITDAITNIKNTKKRMMLDLFLTIALTTGLRPHNIQRLEWSEVDYIENAIVIPAAKMKGKRICRIPLSKQAKEKLQAWRKAYTSISPYVFSHRSDIHKPHGDFGDAFKKIIKAAGVSDDVTLYVLTRHTFASHMLMQTGNLPAVSDQLQHTNIHITKKRYAKFDMSYKTEVLQPYLNKINSSL